MALKVLGISGSTHEASKTCHLVQGALQIAEQCGAITEFISLYSVELPVFVVGKKDLPPQVAEVRKKVAVADAYIIGTPEYHGAMSGALKNFLDYHFNEFGGKLFGLVIATGGSQGVSAAENLRAAIQYCHGWTLPYQVAAQERDFNENNKLTNEKVQDRLLRMGRDIVTYGALLITAFRKELSDKPDAAGFAAWHLPKKN